MCGAEPALPPGVYPAEERERSTSLCSDARTALSTDADRDLDDPADWGRDSQGAVHTTVTTGPRGSVVSAQLGWIPGLLRPVEKQCPGLSPGWVHMEDTAKDTANTGVNRGEGLPGRGVGVAHQSSVGEPWGPEAG